MYQKEINKYQYKWKKKAKGEKEWRTMILLTSEPFSPVGPGVPVSPSLPADPFGPMGPISPVSPW